MRLALRVLVSTTLLALPSVGQAQQQRSPTTWSELPHLQLERQFAGPLQDTIVQRWRDPGDGTVCYIYLPISAAHSPPTASGYVQYGANAIGSISCFAGSKHAKPPPGVAKAP
jgi:hypothetical protein